MLNNATLIAVNPSWIRDHPQYKKKLFEKNQLCLGKLDPSILGAAHVVIKNKGGVTLLDEKAKFISSRDMTLIQTHLLADESRLQLFTGNGFLLVAVEHAANTMRCAIDFIEFGVLEDLSAKDPSLRFDAFDLPPIETTLLGDSDVADAIKLHVRSKNPDLYGKHADEFLTSAHIIVPLFAHVMSLATNRAVAFPLKLKILSDQIRRLLLDSKSRKVRLHKVKKDHLELWADTQGKRISFLDGGLTSLPGIPGVDPIAIRVGVYSVIPGETDPDRREKWTLHNYVMGDLLEDQLPPDAPDGVLPNRKRLQEASRYYAELFDALKHVSEHKPDAMFLHGPLINQFTMYDEGEPNFIPCLSEEFLKHHEITQESVEEEISDIPETSHGSLWNQFMAIYGYTANKVFRHNTPIFGVVERTAGRWIINEVLNALVSDTVIDESYKKLVIDTLKQYAVSDDFLFGCILREGEYLSPVQVQKNVVRRARERWQPAVRQYPPVAATIIKTSEENFPFRIEANQSGSAPQEFEFFMKLIYHTSRLLPQYAFPVGLDIADKYAKIPRWLSKGISARAATVVLQRAFMTGDKNTVMQVRQYLAHTPRDFFYRPKSGS